MEAKPNAVAGDNMLDAFEPTAAAMVDNVDKAAASEQLSVVLFRLKALSTTEADEDEGNPAELDLDFLLPPPVLARGRGPYK